MATDAGTESRAQPDRHAHLPRLAALGVWLIAMVAFGLPHAMWRHFHVDEIQIAYNIALWGVHGLDSYTNYAAPFMVPLAWLIGALDTTASMLLVMRVAFFLVFLFSLVAVALAQPYFRTRTGRIAVLFAITLFHPFWEHGFEIRHDVLLVAGSIVLYGLAQLVVRRRVAAPGAMLAAGATAAAMLLNAYKGFLYAVPFGGAVLLAALAVTWREPLRRRARSLLWFAAGALASAAACLALLAAAGHLDEYGAVLARFFGGGERPYRFSPVRELVRVALDAPLVYGPAILFLILAAVDLVRQRGRMSGATALTALFLVWNLVALFINPVPFPYNFVHITPFVFLGALDVAARIELDRPRARALAAAGVLSAAALLFGRSWWGSPYMTRTNEAQLSYIGAAEAMTDPARDTVLDGVGLVLTRRPPDRDWMLHSLWMGDYRAGRRTGFGDMMRARPSPVVLGNYRWGWLPDRDLAVLHERYVALYPELYVLGSAPTGAAGEFTIHYAGRYIVEPKPPGGAAALRVDGQPLGGGALELGAGTHRYDGAGAAGIVVYWLGPAGQRPIVLPLVPAARMFTNE
jgi:hypothetical protein